MSADVLSVRALNRATLARQLLLARESCTVVSAVERLCGLQAQEPKPPFIGLWSRVEGFEREQLRAALEAREVVRATLMRGTLHLMSAADFEALRATLRPVLEQGLRLLGDRAEGLDVAAVVPVARGLLEQQPRTFADLRALLVEAFPAVNDRALGFAVRMCVPLVMVPTDDTWAFRSVSAFTLADEWLGRAIGDDPDPRPLVLRYLAAFGPASAADVQAWSGLQGIAAVLADLCPQLEVFRTEQGRELFDLPGAPRPPEDVAAPARFLPEFDNLVLAHADRTRIVADEHRASLVTKNLRVRACFLWDGFVAGTWTTVRKRTAATLELAPFAPLPKRALRSLGEEGVELLRFLEPDATTLDVKVS
jgi:Winged helix DNA-binding domain